MSHGVLLRAVFFFAESSDPTTHENMQGTHTNAWLSHSEMSQSLIGRLPSTTPPKSVHGVPRTYRM